MKSQINQFGKSIYSLGKTLIIAAAFMALGQASASTFRNSDHPQDSFKSDSLAGQKQFSPVEDQAVFNPSLVFTVVNEKSFEQIIAEDKQITESNPTNDGSLLFIEKHVEDIINDNNKIMKHWKWNLFVRCI